MVKSEVQAVVKAIKAFQWEYIRINKDGNFKGSFLFSESTPAVFAFNGDSVFYIKGLDGFFELEDMRETFFGKVDFGCNIQIPEEIADTHIVARMGYEGAEDGLEDVFWFSNDAVVKQLSTQERKDIAERMIAISRLYTSIRY